MRYRVLRPIKIGARVRRDGVVDLDAAEAAVQIGLGTVEAAESPSSALRAPSPARGEGLEAPLSPRGRGAGAAGDPGEGDEKDNKPRRKAKAAKS